DMIFVKPVDEDILAAVAKTGNPIITVEDGTVEGGFGGLVAEWMTAHGYSPRIERLGLPDDFVTHGTPDQLKKLCHIDSESIYNTIKKLV
ncbi:MAG: 1-deoxy-D-xylulose-5-phosphate synthase, partial [Muribaculaceae bacterium]|nr:1-deoxy-D-xylulose-5-phosphate synthase [Muribaculaceae bacterium]